MVEAILEHRQEDFILIFFIQTFSVPCQGSFPSLSPKLQSNLLKVCAEVRKKKKITHEINSIVFKLFIISIFISISIVIVLISKSLYFKALQKSGLLIFVEQKSHRS